MPDLFKSGQVGWPRKRICRSSKSAYGIIDIDMVAVPLKYHCRQFTNPAFAADLMSQAEHDELASAILLTDSNELAEQTVQEINRQVQQLSRKDIIEASLRNFGAIIVCDSVCKMIEIANEVAPEHLEIITREPRAILPKIYNAGAIFLGEYSPEPLGDYMAGPSHVLPTSGTARFFSPLSVDSFLKRRVCKYSKKRWAGSGSNNIICRIGGTDSTPESIQ